MKLEKCILISIKKEGCDLIKSGKKTIEWRKTIPKNIELPCSCFIYETKANGGCGRIIAEFNFYWTYRFSKEFFNHRKSNIFTDEQINSLFKNGCVDYFKLKEYQKNKGLYAIHIENLKIYDEPKPLETLWSDENHPLELSPQSWRYCYKEIE